MDLQFVELDFKVKIKMHIETEALNPEDVRMLFCTYEAYSQIITLKLVVPVSKKAHNYDFALLNAHYHRK